MGTGASVVQDGDDELVGLDTFAVVQEEYRRLSCRDLTDNSDSPIPTDEEVFLHLKSVVTQRCESKHHGMITTGEGAEDTATFQKNNAQAEPKDDAASTADDEEKNHDVSPTTDPDADESSTDANAVEVHDDREHEAHDAEKVVERGEEVAASLLQRPLTAQALLALADTIPVDLPVDGGEEGGLGSDTFNGSVAITTETFHPASLSEGSHGRHGNLALSSTSSSSGSSSTFDLTQNLTPVFTTDVLLDPTTLKMITSYAEREKIAHGGDWIKFWVEIDELAQLPSHSYTHRRLRKIYDKFLSPDAPSPVCVTSGMLTDIETALQSDNISAGIYADAQQVCLTALEQSVYPRFRDNRLFKKMVEFCAPSQVTVRNIPQLQQQGNEPEDYSLQGILTHPAKLRFLKTYCMEALALENLLFYLEVEDCKRLPNLSFIVNKTRKIYDRYCTKGSRNFLDLPDAVFAELHAAAEANQALLPKHFYEAQLLVFQRISDEIWKTFYRTSEYLEYSRKLKPERRRLPYAKNAVKFSPEQAEQVQKKLDAMNEFQLIQSAMLYPVAKLIPLRSQGIDGGNSQMDAAAGNENHAGPVFSPAEQLTILLSDAFGRKFFKQFMHKRSVDHFLAFCHEVDDFKLLPGIEFLQHTAKKIYRKYILPSAKMQVDMSRAMRDEIGERLLNPSIDMFKRISQRVRHGMLQDSMPRFVKSPYYTELKKLAKQFKEVTVEVDLKTIDAAAKKGKLELAHLDMLLQNQLSMKQFRLFLESQHCAENLMLYEEIEHFRRLPSYQIVLRSAKKIYDKYLNPNNTRNPLIPVSEALRNRVVEQLEAACRTTFDEVENECREFMRNVVVPDFLDSRIFMALVGTWAVVDDEYPAEMLKGEFEMAFLRHRFHLVQEERGLSRDTATPKGLLTG